MGATTILFAIWTIAAGLSDNVLKPLMLGRGISVPMPVVLIGALGGMISNGIIGPVVLAVGYELFNSWGDQVQNSSERPASENPTGEPGATRS